MTDSFYIRFRFSTMWRRTRQSFHQIGSLICNQHDKLIAEMTILFCVHIVIVSGQYCHTRKGNEARVATIYEQLQSYTSADSAFIQCDWCGLQDFVVGTRCKTDFNHDVSISLLVTSYQHVSSWQIVTSAALIRLSIQELSKLQYL